MALRGVVSIQRFHHLGLLKGQVYTFVFFFCCLRAAGVSQESDQDVLRASRSARYIFMNDFNCVRNFHINAQETCYKFVRKE